MTSAFDTARQTALKEIDQREKAGKWAIIAAALIESLLFLVIFMVIDLTSDTHRLILLTALLVYFLSASACSLLACIRAATLEECCSRCRCYRRSERRRRDTSR